jgi:hypothetical protein
MLWLIIIFIEIIAAEAKTKACHADVVELLHRKHGPRLKSTFEGSEKVIL